MPANITYKPNVEDSYLTTKIEADGEFMTPEKLAYRAVKSYAHSEDKEFTGTALSFIASYSEDIPEAQIYNLTRESSNKVKSALEKTIKESNWLDDYDVEITLSRASKLISTLKISMRSVA